AGRLDAATEAFFATTEAALRAAFGARGIVVDELDDMASLLGLAPPRGGGPHGA
ncbi:MAG: hypothetical protein IT373_30010, partial [Polyangiaceae bacterium]|nr:hypothetical protein [Polyangiaceae bacterium]